MSALEGTGKELRKWRCNGEINDCTHPLDAKVLDVTWHSQADTLSFPINVKQNQHWTKQGGVENVQYATNHKRKGGGSARAVRSARSASHLEPGLFLAIFLPGIDFVVVQHLIRCLYHKLEKRQQPIVRLIGRSTSLVFGIVSLDFLAVQVSVQFCIRSSSSCSSSWWLIVVRLACRQFSGSGEALGGSGGLCVLSTVTMLRESHPPRWMQLDAKSVGPP